MTPLHRDIILAKYGDKEARSRIQAFENLDPIRYTSACDEIGSALKERWKRKQDESELAHRLRVGAEVQAWFSLDPYPPILVGIPWYSEEVT